MKFDEEFDDLTNESEIIDENKLNLMKARVISLERQNFTTKRLKDNQMVDNIITIINREVQNDN